MKSYGVSRIVARMSVKVSSLCVESSKKISENLTSPGLSIQKSVIPEHTRLVRLVYGSDRSFADSLTDFRNGRLVVTCLEDFLLDLCLFNLVFFLFSLFSVFFEPATKLKFNDCSLYRFIQHSPEQVTFRSEHVLCALSRLLIASSLLSGAARTARLSLLSTRAANHAATFWLT